MDDLQTFFDTVASIATNTAEAVNNDPSDAIGELEMNALLAAAHAFATYQICRAMRREIDARKVPEPAPEPAKELN